MSRDLPQFPNLDHLKKQAKALLRRVKAVNPDARLSEAQHAIARKYGFASWVKLKAYIESSPAPVDAKPEVPAPGGFARYTEPARKTIFFALYRAAERGSPSIETEDLLIGVVDADAKLFNVLLGPSASGEDIRREVQRRVPIRPKSPTMSIPLSDDSKRILKRAVEECDQLHHKEVTPGHFLLGFFHEEKALGTSVLVEALARNGIGREVARDRIVRILEGGASSEP